MKRHKSKILQRILLLFAVLAMVLCLFSVDHLDISTAHAASSKSEACSTVEEIEANFPESYWSLLEGLLEAHPNWKFVAFNTGLTFEECLTQECTAGENLAEGIKSSANGTYYYPTSWYSTTISGAYDWSSNSWTCYDSGNWFQASEEAIAYCMDPRNFLTESSIFMFLDGSTAMEPSEALGSVEYLLSSVGSDYWTQTGEAADLYYEVEVENPEYVAYLESKEAAATAETTQEESTLETADEGEETEASEEKASEEAESSQEAEVEEESTEENTQETEETSESESETEYIPPETITEKHYLTYSEAIVKIAYELGVNPILLAARLRQEQGLGTSPLISGTTSFTLSDGTTTIDGGYYNYFNMQATGNTQAEVINNGLREAYVEGWDTRYKALYGGAKKYATSFVERGQTTLYSQKFNFDSSSSRCFWGQYMQNVHAPISEGSMVYSAVNNSSSMDAEMTFMIPVFTDTLTDHPYPSKDGNPNYKLGMFRFNDEDVPSFSLDTTDYEVTVNGSVASAPISIQMLAPTTTIEISYTTAEGTTDCSVYSETQTINDRQYGFAITTVQVPYGDSTVKVVSTAENGDSETYTLKVTRSGTEDDMKASSVSINGDAVTDFDADTSSYVFGTTLTEGQVTLSGTTLNASGTTAALQLTHDGTTQDLTVEVTTGDTANTFTSTFDLPAGDSTLTLTTGTDDGRTSVYEISVTAEEAEEPETTESPSSEEEPTQESTKETLAETSTQAPAEESTEESTEVTYAKGDVNGDGSYNIIDLTMIRSSILGYSTLSDLEQAAADVNNDGNINIIDITIIRSYILGYTTSIGS